MKVYVEKLPKGCLSCPYIVDKGDYDLCAIKDCVIDDAFKYIDKRKKSCPLLSLSDYTKQVRKEVVDIIEEKFNCCGYVEEKFEDIKKYVLDQIEQGKQND